MKRLMNLDKIIFIIEMCIRDSPIGVRPIDQHIKGFEALGAEVVIELSLIHI